MDFILFMYKHYLRRGHRLHQTDKQISQQLKKKKEAKLLNPVFKAMVCKETQRCKGGVMYTKQSSKHNIWTLSVGMFHRLWIKHIMTKEPQEATSQVLIHE